MCFEGSLMSGFSQGLQRGARGEGRGSGGEAELQTITARRGPSHIRSQVTVTEFACTDTNSGLHPRLSSLLMSSLSTFGNKQGHCTQQEFIPPVVAETPD